MGSENGEEETPPVEAEESPTSPRHVRFLEHMRPATRQTSEQIVFAGTNSPRASAARRDHPLFPEPPASVEHEDLMGPILRRKKVVSMPLGMGGDFFVHEDVGGPHRQLVQHDEDIHPGEAKRIRQMSLEGIPVRKRQETPPTPLERIRKKQSSFMKGLVRRKQVSLDLLGPNDFFAVPTEEEQELEVMPTAAEEEEEEELAEEEVEVEEKKKLPFLPLRFSPRMVPKVKGGHHGAGGGHHGAGGGHGPECAFAPPELSTIDEETSQAMARFSQTSEVLGLQMSSLKNQIEEHEEEHLKSASEQMLETYASMKDDESLLKSKLLPPAEEEEQEDGDVSENGSALVEDGDNKKEIASAKMEGDSDDTIIKATRSDKIKAGVVFAIMLAFTVIICTWDTHINEHAFIHEPVGLACVTSCPGDVETRDFFVGHNRFEKDQVIQLIIHLDPNVLVDSETRAVVEIVGDESREVKAVHEFGPIDHHYRFSYDEKITVNFDNPGEPHIINVNSTDPTIELSFTLLADVQIPLSGNSVLIAALIMIFVYFFILIEVIHRTLVAIFGSMIALTFLFIMQGGETYSIGQIMLWLEWSTLGLLFGMMLIVGELSHTGVFEWCAVRLLMASGGSYKRLMVLLCTLTAIASAFLDNVTTMLLVAPVTIDMCNILEVDPRPYLIGEVLLSNIGGTATLIGDPPNIIIGSSFEEIDFVDFITNVLPAIFLFCIPASLVLVVWIYRYYLTLSKMRVLDTATLKKTYPIYDEPRLLIAGTVTFFVIVDFFLHSVHHKDTAWIALFGAFITIAFTNPHDVQDALRNHVEWDTLLFFAGLFVLVEACAEMGLLDAIGEFLANIIENQPEDSQLTVAITLVMWVSAIVSAFLDNIPYTATMVPIIQILADTLPETLSLSTLAWALSFGACLGGNGTLLGASANIVTAGISTNKGFEISFLNFLYPGMLTMVVTVAISNLYMLVRYAWV